MPDWLELYHALPWPLKFAAASLRGYSLRSWRYGPETERLVGETLGREHWSAEQWKKWQGERLAFVLHRAATRVPCYREHWAARRRAGDNVSWDSLDNWPILEKETIRANPQAFLADDCTARGMFEEHTSGTTGTPLRLWFTRDTLIAYYALFECRVRQWSGLSRWDRWGMLGGQMVIPFSQRTPPFWVANYPMRQIYLSSYHLSPEFVTHYLKAIQAHRLKYLLGYASSLASLAELALDSKVRDIRFQAAFSNAEPLYPHQRDVFREAFGCHIRNTYGMSECVALASECEAGRMHLSPEVGICEVLDADNKPVPYGQAGKLVGTGLLNAEMPLIRYCTGDFVVLEDPAIECACGRRLPILREVWGRDDDLVLLADGRRVGRLDPVFKTSIAVREAQIIQEDVTRFRLLYVPGSTFKEHDINEMVRRLRERVGEVEVHTEKVESIPRSANGKFRAVICNLPSNVKDRHGDGHLQQRSQGRAVWLTGNSTAMEGASGRGRNEALNMSNRFLKLYHFMPWPLRFLAASLHGWRLQRWRYGPETERLVEEAHDRESWSATQWKAWQEKRLEFLLHRAATEVPYYMEHWAARRRSGDRSSYEYLENWPILEKETVRASPRAFLAGGCSPWLLYHDHTTGTTNKPLSIWLSQDTVRQWYALFEARCRRWHGVSMRDRWAILGGALVVPQSSSRPPFWVWNCAARQLYLSPYHLSPQFIPYYLDALVKYRIRYLYGYSVSLQCLAVEALRRGWQPPGLAVAITNAEPLFGHQRRIIARAFNCPVRETYGMAEIVTAACECEHGQMHLWPEAGIVEIMNGSEPVPLGGMGDLVCTGLLNADMPFVRYRLGDTGGVNAPESLCRCGRRLPTMQSIGGRTDDVFITADGRLVPQLNPVYSDNAPFREAQLIQESLHRIRVKYVPTSEFNKEAGTAMIKHIKERMGDVEVVLDPVAEIPRGPGGKFREAVCSLSPEERAAWRLPL